MNAVHVINVDAIIPVFQHENDAFRQFISGRNNSMHAEGLCFQVFVRFHIVQQIKPEFVQAQIHDGNAGGHLFDIHHLILQLFQLSFPVFQVALFLRIDQIVIACGGHDRNLHASFHAGFQVDVFIQRHIRPEVDQLDLCVAAANTVNTPKTLNDAHGVPVNIIVDQIIAILQVLAFGDTIRRNQNINFRCAAGHQHIPVFGYGRKAGKQVIQSPLQTLDGAAAIRTAGDNGRIQAILFLDKRRDVLIQVFSGIGKGREDHHFFVAGIDRILDFLGNQLHHRLQLGVILRGNVLHHGGQQSKLLRITPQHFSPAFIIHISQIDLGLLANGKEIGILIFHIEIGGIIADLKHIQIAPAGTLKFINGFDGAHDQVLDAFQSQAEGMYRALQAL